MSDANLSSVLRGIFEKRGGAPAGALVRWATWQRGFLAGLVQFLDQRSDVRPSRDYGLIQLREEWFELEVAVSRLAATFAEPQGEGALFPGKFSTSPSVSRRTPTYSTNLTEWCEWWIEGRVSDPRGTVQAPPEMALAPGLPPYDSCERAIEEWLTGRDLSAGGRCRYLGELSVVITDPRGIVSAVRWEGSKLSASVRSGRSVSDLELQAVVETDRGRLILPPQRPAPENHEWDLPDDARLAQVFLVHESRDSMGMTRVTPGARVRAAEEALSVSEQATHDLGNGENDRVEFKPFIEKGDDKWWEVARSIVAFANTYGGRLYLGVLNLSGDPEGQKTFDRILKDPSSDREKLYTGYIDEQVRTRVKPVPMFKISRASHFGQPVLVISVASGFDKPYSTSKDEVFIRKGSTNQRPDPQTELRRLYDVPVATTTDLFGNDLFNR